MDNEASAKRNYEARKAMLEQMEAIEVAAAVTVAQTDMQVGAGINMYNSVDNSIHMPVEDQPSFMRLNESKNQGRKWHPGTLDDDDNFRAEMVDNVSEHDAMAHNVKRSNLVQLFIRGTEIDDYIVNNLWGKERYVNNEDPDMTMGEVTMLDGLNMDETFTH